MSETTAARAPATPSAAPSPASLPLPPGGLGVPFLGQTLAFLANPFAFLEGRFRAHGPVFKFRLLGDPVVCFVGPEALGFFYDAQRITRAGGSPPHLQELLHPATAPFIEGPAQRTRRGFLLQAFAGPAIETYQPLVERIIGRYLERWASSGAEVRGVDAIGTLCFSLAQSLFLGADPEADPPPAMTAAFDRVSAGFLAVPIALGFTTYGKALQSRDELRAAIAPMIGAYKAGAGKHVLDTLVGARDAAGAPIDREGLAQESLHLLFAAYAGLQAALCDLVLALADNPAVESRAREEVRGAPASAGVAGLAYVDRVCKEVRRFYPIVPTSFFGVVREEASFGGLRIPAGWKACAALHSTMRDERTFQDPTRFDPERFAPGRDEGARPNAYVPQGGGPMEGHRCAGEALATRILVTFAAMLLRGYKLELPPQDRSLDGAGRLAPLPKDGLRMRLVKG